MPTRSETLRTFHEAAGFEFPFAVTRQLFHDWHVHPINAGGELAGAYITKGPEIHVAVLPAHRGRWFFKWCRTVLADLIAQHGKLLTSVMRANEAGQRFVERVGFRRVSDDPVRVYYEMSEVR